MKNKFFKMMLPMFALILAVTASFVSNAQNESTNSNNVNGYLQNNGNPQACTDSGKVCTTDDTGTICQIEIDSEPENLHRYDEGSTSCFDFVYEPVP